MKKDKGVETGKKNHREQKRPPSKKIASLPKKKVKMSNSHTLKTNKIAKNNKKVKEIGKYRGDKRTSSKINLSATSLSKANQLQDKIHRRDANTKLVIKSNFFSTQTR